MHYRKITVWKLSLILTILIPVFNTPAKAQYIRNHVGIRSGIYSGIYYQNLISAGTAETSFFVMMSINHNHVRATVMKLTYETSLNEVSENLFFVWGYGGHAGFGITDYIYFLGKKYQFEYSRFRPLMGADGWAGLEYRFGSIPLVVGLNIKPYAELIFPGFLSIKPGDVGLSFAYMF